MWPAARALSSAPNLAESHTADAFVKFLLDWDLPVAEQGFRRALELDPSDALAHRTLGIVYLDRRQEARAFAAMACQLDPLNAAHHALCSQKAFFGREYEQSLQYATQAIALDRDFWVGHLQLAQAAEQLGQHAVALEALDQAGTFSGNNSKVLALTGLHSCQMRKPARGGRDPGHTACTSSATLRAALCKGADPNRSAAAGSGHDYPGSALSKSVMST